MTFPIDTVCTHQDVVDELGTTRELGTLIPRERNGSTEIDRTIVLRDVLRVLARRSPPIFEGDITDPTELRQAVAIGTVARLYRIAITDPEGTSALMSKDYYKRYEVEVSSMRITVTSGSNASPQTLRVFRS